MSSGATGIIRNVYDPEVKHDTGDIIYVENLTKIESAILNEKTIKFSYKDGSSTREVAPYRIFLWNGFWYFIGKDIQKKEIRSFKVSRIYGEVIETKTKNSIPDNFDIKSHLPKAEAFSVILEIPEGKALILRNQGKIERLTENSDKCTIDFPDSETALREILRYGRDVKILEPKVLASALRLKLEELSNV